MEVLQRSHFSPQTAKKAGDLWKTYHKTPGFLYSKASPGLETSAKSGKRFMFLLRSRNFGQMRSQSAVIPFHPDLFQVKCKRQKEQLCAYVFPSPREEAAEPKVIFE